MKKNTKLFLAAAIVAASFSAHAAVVTVGALTRDEASNTIYDSLHQRQWLGFDATRSLTYAQTVAATGAGGVFEGYHFARNGDAQLFINAMSASNSCTVSNAANCLVGASNIEKVVGESHRDYRAAFNANFDLDMRCSSAITASASRPG